ncbi:NADH:flavin oxidoreductase/NADH oxidase [Streptomyces sp. NPDC050560]|uniref:NADH:flavin oxidoreductase/NADH oxidase n=1 Tax=Streptomyces sp. NPDC050560 TaxID=3365630 RepID=UPI003787525E
MSALFEPYTLRSVTFPNRVWMSPMCQYSADTSGPLTGAANEWHHAHYGARAVGGAGLVMTEATAVSPEGRISPADLGIWNDTQADALRPIASFVKQRGGVPGVQLAHAGRKASTSAPWLGGGPLSPADGGWEPVAPSAVPFDDGRALPAELTVEQIGAVAGQFREAARRALDAGFEVAEVHGAHGYLIHQFLSPLSNKRADEYGGSFGNRVRFALQVVDAVREVWPEDKPLFFRVSATDWLDEVGWSDDDTVRLAPLLKEHGVDLVDTSTGGNAPRVRIPAGPGYQVRFAERVRREGGLATAAVGVITEPGQAEKIIAGREADAVLLGRALLRDPYWPQHAASELGVRIAVPDQYARAH